MKAQMRLSGRLVFRCVLMVTCLCCWSLWSGPALVWGQVLQRLQMPASPNPVGSGARALGMGGAFIAVADDATASSWNPAGLIQLEAPEVSFVLAGVERTEDNTFGTNSEASGEQKISMENVNYLSATFPFTVAYRNMVVSLNYQHLYDFTRSWEFPMNWSSGVLTLDRHINYEQKGGLSALGLGYAVQLNPYLSVGLAVNWWDKDICGNGWEQTTREAAKGSLGGIGFTASNYINDHYTFEGWNVNLGLLWDINSKLTVGAVFKTPFTADLEHESTYSYSIEFPTFPAANSQVTEKDSFTAELDMPMSYGLGVAYRFSDAFTMSLDVYRTEWGDFVLRDETGRETSPISCREITDSTIGPTHQVRLGAEYLIIGEKFVIPLRAGVFYDPSPAEGGPDDYFGFSLGTGLAYGRFVFDVAYQYRFGRDVGQSTLENLKIKQDIDEHTLYMSVIVHF